MEFGVCNLPGSLWCYSLVGKNDGRIIKKYQILKIIFPWEQKKNSKGHERLSDWMPVAGRREKNELGWYNKIGNFEGSFQRLYQLE